MTHKATDSHTLRRGKPKLHATRSEPALIFTPLSKQTPQQKRRCKSTMQVHPVSEATTISSPKTRWINLPNEEFRVCVDNNEEDVIDTAEPYLVPITTKAKETALKQLVHSKQDFPTSKKVQSLTSLSPSEEKTDWKSFVSAGKPIPPPKIVHKSGVKVPENSKVTFENKDKVSRAERRELAYLVVDLTSANRERKKSFDDLDAELQLKSIREKKPSLTRSRTVSIPGPLEQSGSSEDTDSMSTSNTNLSPPKSHKKVMRKLPADISKNRRYPLPVNTKSNKEKGRTSGTAESVNMLDRSMQSSEKLQSSGELSDSIKISPPSVPKLNKNKELLEQRRKRRAPPPPPSTLSRTVPPPRIVPPPTLLTSPTPPHNPCRHRSVDYTRVRHPSNSGIITGRRVSNIDTKHTMAKSSSTGKLPARQAPKRPIPSAKPKLKESKSSLVPSSGANFKVKPTISNPHLISSTKPSIPVIPVTGPFRNLPSPPAIARSPPGWPEIPKEQDTATTSPYEDVDFLSPTSPTPPPRPKRAEKKIIPVPSLDTKSRMLAPTIVKPYQPNNTSKTALTMSKTSLSKSVTSPGKLFSGIPDSDLRDVPEDYLEPLAQMRGSDEEEQSEDYVDMRPGVVNEWTVPPLPVLEDTMKDESEGCYVEMQPGKKPSFDDDDDSNSVYVEMKPGIFKPPPPKKQESLYYAINDLMVGREDLKVKKTPKLQTRKRH